MVLEPAAGQQVGGDPAPVDIGRPDDDEGQANEHSGQGQGGGRVLLPLQVNGQRHRAGDALLGAGEGDGRPELAQAPAQGQGRAPSQSRCRQRQRHLHQNPPRAGPEAPGGDFGPLVTAAQRRLQSDHQERHGDEHLGNDHRGSGEGDGRPPLLQVRPQQAAVAQGGQQCDTGHHRRHRHRQHREDPRDPHPRPAAGQQ